jgi:hypothetical protein
MFLIQILLPLHDNSGHPFPASEFQRVRDELSQRFGGITTHVRSPAVGLWRETPETTVHDEIITYEIMTEDLDRTWWKVYRQGLAERFRQQVLVVRASEVEIL